MHLLQHSHNHVNHTVEQTACLDLAQQIIKVRQKMNISQTELAAKLCISARTLESW